MSIPNIQISTNNNRRGSIGVGAALQKKSSWMVLGLLLIGVPGCSWRAPTDKKIVKPVQGGVSLSNVVLTQTNAQGQLLWKIAAKGVTYGEDQQQLTAKALKGQLYQEGKPLFDLIAGAGSAQIKNQQIRLKGNIQVKDRRQKLVFAGREAFWNPKSGTLLVRSGLTVTHPQAKLWADELQVSQRGQQVRLQGKVLAESRDRRFRVKATRALWLPMSEVLEAGLAAENGQQPSVEIEQFKGKTRQGQALAGQARTNFKTGLVTLSNPAQLQIEPSSLLLTSRTLTWDTAKERLSSPELLKLEDRRQKITALSNTGSLDLSRNLIDLQGKVEVVGLQDGARLTSNRFLWKTDQQRIEALGDVHYQQQSPPFTLKGPRAVGRITEQMVRVSGGEVVTEIVP
jgi:LPS export ABC transporter protein LptC